MGKLQIYRRPKYPEEAKTTQHTLIPPLISSKISPLCTYLWSSTLFELPHFLVFSLRRAVLKVVLYSFAGLQWLSSEVNWDLKTEFYDAPRSNIVPSWPQGNTMHCSQSIALFSFEYCMGSIAVLHGQCIKQPEVVVRPLISPPPLHSTAPSPLSLIPNLHLDRSSELHRKKALPRSLI